MEFVINPEIWETKGYFINDENLENSFYANI